MKRFITSNAHVGIELNAHSLIAFIEYCKKHDVPIQFIVRLLSSQHCEGLFRSLRSESTTNQTVVNFTAKELTSKLKSTQFKLDVMYRHKENFDFPAMDKMNKRKIVESLPTFEQIQSAITDAQAVAREELAKVGIPNANLEPTIFRTNGVPDTTSTEQTPEYDLLEADDEDDDDDGEDFDKEDAGENESVEAINPADEEGSLRETAADSEQSEVDIGEMYDDFLPPEFVAVDDEFNSEFDGTIHSEISDEVYELDELFPDCNGTLNLKSSTSGSRHTFNIRDRSGKVKIIKKQTLVWMMTDGRYHLSTDRLRQKAQQKEKR